MKSRYNCTGTVNVQGDSSSHSKLIVQTLPDRDGGFVSDRKNRVYPALTFWVVTNVDYMSVADFETKLRQIMLKAGLDIDHCTPVKSRKKTSALDAYTAPLCQVIKDHKWAYARDLVGKPFYRLSATAVCEYVGVHIDPDNIESQPYLEDLSSTQEFSKRIVRMWITTSCPQLVASKIRQALTNMRYADLFYDIVDEESSSAKSAESTESNVLPLHCPSNKTLVVIRYVQRTMHKLNYALYRGHIYKKPSESKFACVYTTTVKSFLNTLLANKKIAEVLISQLQQVNVILSNRECSIIKQIQIYHNLIEVLPTGTSSNVLHSSSLLLKVIWRCSTSLLHYMVSQNMVSQSSYGSIIWFLNHRMVPLYGFSVIVWFHYMVSQSSYGSIIWFLNHRMVPLYGFSIIVWFHYMVSQSSYDSIIWFLNHRMVPLYGFSIIVWFHYMVSQSSYGSIIWFLNHHMVPLYGFLIKKWFPKRWFSRKFGKLYVSKSDKCV